jgi:hypothetical protein
MRIPALSSYLQLEKCLPLGNRFWAKLIASMEIVVKVLPFYTINKNIDVYSEDVDTLVVYVGFLQSSSCA